jgi:Co/Zn/Cd efflux system component
MTDTRPCRNRDRLPVTSAFVFQLLGSDLEGPAQFIVDQKPAHLNPAYRTALLTCSVLNIAFAFIEGIVGLWIGSAALFADAGDFLEDAAVLGLAVAAIRWSLRARATAGLVQGVAMAAVGLGAIVQIVLRILNGGAPSPVPMGSIAVLALIVNAYCAYRLIRFRRGDASMRAIWLSTRNDAVLNVLTVAAAVSIAIIRSGWPDIIAGAIIATVNLWGSVEIISAAIREIRKAA